MRDRWIADLRARGVHQRWILFAGLAGMFAGMFPFTVLAVSLKSIAAELGSTETTMAWVVTAPILFPVLGGNSPVSPISPLEFTDSTLSDVGETRLSYLPALPARTSGRSPYPGYPRTLPK